MMTPQEIELARHALGLDGRRKQSYRNRFCADYGHTDYQAWLGMVRRGLAYRVPADRAGTVGDMFYLYQQAAEQTLRPGETLDLEDFPSAATTKQAG